MGTDHGEKPKKKKKLLVRNPLTKPKNIDKLRKKGEKYPPDAPSPKTKPLKEKSKTDKSSEMLARANAEKDPRKRSRLYLLAMGYSSPTKAMIDKHMVTFKTGKPSKSILDKLLIGQFTAGANLWGKLTGSDAATRWVKGVKNPKKNEPYDDAVQRQARGMGLAKNKTTPWRKDKTPSTTGSNRPKKKKPYQWAKARQWKK